MLRADTDTPTRYAAFMPGPQKKKGVVVAAALMHTVLWD